jgi:hypothetical protein
LILLQNDHGEAGNRKMMGLSSELDFWVIHNDWPEIRSERTEMGTETEIGYGDAEGDSSRKFFVDTNPHK